MPVSIAEFVPPFSLPPKLPAGLTESIAGFVPLVAASLVGAAGGAYWPIATLIALGGLVGFVCILLVRPAGAARAPQRTD